METDDICDRYADEKVGIVLRLLTDEDGIARTVLAEGRPTALRMLGELLIAVADGKSGESFHISPFGPVTYISTPSQNWASTYTGLNKHKS